jgi:hypothetical protein
LPLFSVDGIDALMSEFAWKHPERRDLFLACRILAEGVDDGDWLQWASDTLTQDLELYEDPHQGAGFWIVENEVGLANEVGDKLWALVQDNPFEAAKRLNGPEARLLKQAAADLVNLMKRNGR